MIQSTPSSRAARIWCGGGRAHRTIGRSQSFASSERRLVSAVRRSHRRSHPHPRCAASGRRSPRLHGLRLGAAVGLVASTLPSSVCTSRPPSSNSASTPPSFIACVTRDARRLLTGLSSHIYFDSCSLRKGGGARAAAHIAVCGAREARTRTRHVTSRMLQLYVRLEPLGLGV